MTRFDKIPRRWLDNWRRLNCFRLSRLPRERNLKETDQPLTMSEDVFRMFLRSGANQWLEDPMTVDEARQISPQLFHGRMPSRDDIRQALETIRSATV